MGVTRETVRSWETGRKTPRGRKREAYVRLLTAAEVTVPQERSAPSLVGAATGPVQTSQEQTDPTPEPGPELEPQPELKVAPEPRPQPQSQPQAQSDLKVEPKPRREPEPEPVREPRPEPSHGSPSEPEAASLTPAQAFDALYAYCAPALVRQTYLLTGRRELARESVERAFQLAWHRWPEVAMDRDPAGWVRATAHEFALSPWHKMRPGTGTRNRRPRMPRTAHCSTYS